MNPGRFFMPNYMAGSIPRNAIINNIPRNMGLFSKITNGFRSINWGALLSNTNKTLDVVNQTIPLIRQTAPMFNNMRSMLRIAKAFGRETNSNSLNSNFQTEKTNQIQNENNRITLAEKKEVVGNGVPNFFV